MNQDFQEALIERFSSLYTSRSELVAWLAELLHLNPRAVYKRLSGETPFALQEAIKIAQTLHLDLNALAGIKPDTLEFQAFRFQAPPSSPKAFLEGVMANLAWVQGLAEPVIHFSTNDFPLFLCAASPNLLKFKMMIWGRYIWNWKGYEEKKFNVHDPDFDGIEAYSRQIFKAYERIPSVEYWSPTLFDYTLKQASYVLESGGFSNAESFTCLIAEFRALLNQANQIAVTGVKGTGASIQLFRTDLMSHGVMALVNWQSGSRIYLMATNPNSMYSDNAMLTDHAKHWFKHLADTGVPLSGSNERERAIFFRQIADKIPV